MKTVTYTVSAPRRCRVAQPPWRAVHARAGAAMLALALLLGPAIADPVVQPPRISLAVDGKVDRTGVPAGWALEVFHNTPHIKIERLQDGRFGIRLVSEASSFGLHKSVDVDLAEFPVLSWRWKVDRLPPDGDIREARKDDQAAQLYVVFPTFLGFRSPTIGYLWDSNAPVGTVADGHSKVTPIKVIVLQSGKQRLGEWIRERRNVAEDYRRLFNTASVPKVGRVVIWTNTQHTKSSADATFADLEFLQAN